MPIADRECPWPARMGRPIGLEALEQVRSQHAQHHLERIEGDSATE